MKRRWPKVHWKEEGMRDGIQIEDASISVEDKVRLLDALSETGLKHIVVGSFVVNSISNLLRDCFKYKIPVSRDDINASSDR